MGAADNTTAGKLAAARDELKAAQSDLICSLMAELEYGDSARLHYAEAVNTDLTFFQRETHHRLYMQYHGQHAGQAKESNRLRSLINLLQGLIAQMRVEIEDAQMQAISNVEFLGRTYRGAPVALDSALAAGMDDMAEVAA